MEQAMQNIQISVPQVDISFLKTLVRKMGWKLVQDSSSTECHLDKAIASAKRGPLYETNDIEDLMNALNR